MVLCVQYLLLKFSKKNDQEVNQTKPNLPFYFDWLFFLSLVWDLSGDRKFLIIIRKIDSAMTSTQCYWQCDSVFTNRWEIRCIGISYFSKRLLSSSGTDSQWWTYSCCHGEVIFHTCLFCGVHCISDATQIPASLGTPTAKPALQRSVAQWQQ